MNDFLKYGALAGGAYLLWRKYAESAAPAATTPAASSTTTATTPAVGSTAATTPAPATVAAAQVATTKELVYQLAERSLGTGWDKLLSAHQWGYYYQQVRGIPAPNPDTIWPGRDSGFRMSLDEYWSGASAAGLSGLGNYAVVFGRGRGR